MIPTRLLPLSYQLASHIHTPSVAIELLQFLRLPYLKHYRPYAEKRESQLPTFDQFFLNHLGNCDFPDTFQRLEGHPAFCHQYRSLPSLTVPNTNEALIIHVIHMWPSLLNMDMLVHTRQSAAQVPPHWVIQKARTGLFKFGVFQTYTTIRDIFYFHSLLAVIRGTFLKQHAF